MSAKIKISAIFLISIIGLIFSQESSLTTEEPCGENEEIKCPKACGSNCSDVYSLDTCFDMCWQPPKCDCISGYSYSETLKKCVLIEECPRSEIVCPLNQKYTDCKTENPCKPGCVCKQGYKLDGPTGQCYSGSALCPDPKSYWDTCSNSCSHKTCKTIDEPMWCAEVLRCIPACSCSGEYILNEKSGKCVTEEYCRKHIKRNH